MLDWYESWCELMRMRKSGIIRDRYTSKYALTSIFLRECKKHMGKAK